MGEAGRSGGERRSRRGRGQIKSNISKNKEIMKMTAEGNESENAE